MTEPIAICDTGKCGLFIPNRTVITKDDIAAYGRIIVLSEIGVFLYVEYPLAQPTPTFVNARRNILIVNEYLKVRLSP
jgi:hypothetical protein